MRIGLAIRLYGIPGSPRPLPTWQSLRHQALTAEATGFDLVVVEDALSFPLEDKTVGLWESISVLAAMAEATTTIDVGHSVLNGPYRSPGMVAKVAETLDEISGGRYILGIGAGNSPDADYAAFGFPADHRYSRFAEQIEIVHRLLRHGRVDYEGAFHTARGAEMVLRGPRAQGPPIVIAAAGPKMLGLVARFADGWNWWAKPHATPAELRPMMGDLDRACEEAGRDPATLARSLDLYFPVGPERDDTGSSDQAAAEAILAFGDLGVTEVRCYLPAADTHDDQLAAISGMEGVVERVRRG